MTTILKMIRLFCLFYLLLLIISCSSTKKSSDITDHSPQWIKEFPISQTHYIGIGLADKNKYPTEYIKIAQKNALQNLISQIKVNISSQSQMFRIQKELELKQDINSFIKVKSENIIEGYELIDTYTNGNEYWVYYKLDKEHYNKIKNQKINSATEKSKVFIQKALKSSNLKEKYISFVSALNELEPYFNESIITELYGNQVSLKSEIISLFRSFINDYSIKSISKEISLRLLNLNSKISFIAMHSNQPVSNLKLDIFSNNLNFNHLSNQTDHDGLYIISINKIKELSAHHSVEIAPNFNDWLYEAHVSEFIEAIIKKITVPSFSIPLNILIPNFKITSIEKHHDNISNRNDLLLATQAKLTSMGIEIANTNNEAQLHIVINAESKKGTHLHGQRMFTSFLKVTFQIYNEKKDIIFSKTIDDIKGIQLSYEKSELDAYNKAKILISEQIIPEFFNSL